MRKPTLGTSMSSAAASRSCANRSAQPVNDLEKMTPATCGLRHGIASASFDPDDACLRTFQVSLLADISQPSLETWPKAGIVCGGAFYPQPSWVRRISEIGSGLLPTPAAHEPGWAVGGQVEIVDKDGNTPTHYNQRWYDKNTGRLVQKGVTQVAQMWPTPTSFDANGIKRTPESMEKAMAGRKIPGRNGGAPKNLQEEVLRNMYPTPTAYDANDVKRSPEGWAKRAAYRQSIGRDHIGTAGLSEHIWLEENDVPLKISQWPTPSASVIEPKSNVVKLDGRTPQDPQVGLADKVGGRLNPDWVEWLMGWPIGWTSLEPLSPESFARWLDATTTGDWWLSEPDIPRVAKDVPNRVGRLKAIGNGQVSIVAAVAWNVLSKEICA